MTKVLKRISPAFSPSPCKERCTPLAPPKPIRTEGSGAQPKLMKKGVTSKDNGDSAIEVILLKIISLSFFSWQEAFNIALLISIQIHTWFWRVRSEKLSHKNGIKLEKSGSPRFSDNPKYPHPLQKNLVKTPRTPLWISNYCSFMPGAHLRLRKKGFMWEVIGDFFQR